MDNKDLDDVCEECEKSNIAFDFERLKLAVESPTIEFTLPKGSSKEEIRQFIINSATMERKLFK